MIGKNPLEIQTLSTKGNITKSDDLYARQVTSGI